MDKVRKCEICDQQFEIITKSISFLKEEIKKCDLLCSNCHAEAHQELYEKGYSQFNPDI